MMGMVRAQREDLRRFALLAIRSFENNAIAQRNSGLISEADYTRLMELIGNINRNATIETLLDSFEPKCDVEDALDELDPIPSLLRRGGPDVRDRGIIARVEVALRALRGT